MTLFDYTSLFSNSTFPTTALIIKIITPTTIFEDNYQKFHSTMVNSNISILTISNFSSFAVALDSTEFQPFTKASTSEMVEMIYQMILFLVGTPINVVALVNFSKSSISSSSEMRLMRLSRQLLISHLMVLCIYCVWRTYWFYNITWVQGNILCKVYSFLTALPFHLWSNVVAAIAADMLYCISAPLSSVHNGNKRVSWLIRICWVAAIIFSAPMILFRGTVKIPNTDYEQCYPLVNNFDDSVFLMFHVFHVMTTFYFPLCIIVICYVCIGLTLRVRMAERQTLSEDRRKCHNVNTKFLFGTACIVCTFILTWLPYQAMALLRIICAPDSKCEIFVSKMTWLQAILITSTCINPFLYKFKFFNKNRRNVSNFTLHSQIGALSCAESSARPSSPANRFQKNNNLRDSVRSWGAPNLVLLRRLHRQLGLRLSNEFSNNPKIKMQNGNKYCLAHSQSSELQRCHNSFTPPTSIFQHVSKLRIKKLNSNLEKGIISNHKNINFLLNKNTGNEQRKNSASSSVFSKSNKSMLTVSSLKHADSITKFNTFNYRRITFPNHSEKNNLGHQYANDHCLPKCKITIKLSST